MAQTIRSGAVVITRAASGGVMAFAEEESIHGKAENIKIPDIVLPHNDRYGPIGTERDWNHTVELTDFTFDLLQANQVPESLGPVDLNFDIIQMLVTGKRRKFRVRGKLQTGGGPTNDRATDLPRTMTIFPYQYVIGGGASGADSIAEHQETLDKPSTSAATGAYSYVDTREGNYLTRVPGAIGIQHLPLPTS